MSDSQYHIQTERTGTVSDEALLERFLAGDDQAFTTLYERYDSGVLTYLRTVLKERQEVADDLFQETFVKVFKERERRKKATDAEYAQIKNFKGWLFRVAHNLAISYLRSHRQSVSLSEGEEDPGQWDERLMVPIEESFSTLFGEDKERAGETLYERFRICLEMLPAALREVFTLREINGLEYEQVAEIAGCTPEAARMRISRARRALRKALEDQLGDE